MEQPIQFRKSHPIIHQHRYEACTNPACHHGHVKAGTYQRIVGRCSDGTALRAGIELDFFEWCETCNGQGRVKVGGGK